MIKHGNNGIMEIMEILVMGAAIPIRVSLQPYAFALITPLADRARIGIAHPYQYSLFIIPMFHAFIIRT